MDTVSLTAALRQFTGTEQYHAHQTRRLVYTDGVKFLAESAKAYWLIDAIASYQGTRQIAHNPALCSFQAWELMVKADKSAALICRIDSGQPYDLRQLIESTDFPLPEFKLFVAAGGPQGSRVLMLPSEY
jgi:hypothetical protein